MARTPLFRELSRLLRTARAAAHAQIPVLEHHEARADHRLTRRRFLQGAAALTVVPLVPACGRGAAPEAPLRSDARVVIVGGGMAGLHAAHRLHGLGIPSTIYESSSRTGGRMFSDRKTFPGGMHCELGGELIDTGHVTMLDLARELGVELLDYREDDPALTTTVGHFGGRRLTTAEVLEGFVPIAAQIDAALASLPDGQDSDISYRGASGAGALDAMSISEWLDSIGAAGPVRALLETAYTIEFGLEAGEQSALNLLLMIDTGTGELREFGESDERFHAAAGNDSYTTLLARRLPESTLQLGATLRAIRPRGDGYTLAFERDATTFDVPADHVVLTLPFTRLREVEIGVELPPVKRRAIAELGYGTNTKVMVGFGSRVWRGAPHASNGSSYTDLGYQASWETSRLQPGDSGIITHFSGGLGGLRATEGTSEERMRWFVERFEQVFPGAAAASNGLVARMSWPTHPHTLGSYATYKVGQLTTICGAEGERVGNLHFAGEHTSVEAQGYMEGAAATGAEVALAVAEALGVPAAAMARSGVVSLAASRILMRAEASRAQAPGRRLRRLRVPA